jgi:hypothetical protein
MPMYFALEHLPDPKDEDEIPPLLMTVDDDVIRALVRNTCLEANKATDPAKVIAAIEFFLRGTLSESTPQKMMTTTRQ